MKKIVVFFKSISSSLGVVAHNIWAKIFKKQAEEEKKNRLLKNIIIAMIAVIILIAIGFGVKFAIGKIWPEKNTEPATVLGQAKIYIVTAHACGNKCWDTKLFIDALAQKGVKIVGTETVYVDGWWPFNGGANFAKQEQITKVPTVVVEFQGANQPDINNFFNPTLGNVVNKKFVLSKILAPYYDMTAKQLKGLIKVTYLTDKSCPACYDIKKHEIALKNLGVSTAGSQTFDISSSGGKDLIAKYKITKVPTFVITGEVAEYSVLTAAWPEVGTITADGAYVFTNMDLMGDSYKNLTTGAIVKADISKYQATAPVVPSTPAKTAVPVKK